MSTALTQSTNPTEGNSLIKLSGDVIEKAEKLRSAWEEGQRAIFSARMQKNHVVKALLQAKLITELEKLIDGDVLKLCKSLMDRPNGFMTDSESRHQAYDDDTIKACIVSALMAGAQIAGEQFCIIAGRYYLAKNGCKHIFRSLPYVSSIRVQIGIPVFHQVNEKREVAYVSAKISYQVNGQPDEVVFAKDDEIDTRLVIRVNRGMGEDAIKGKAIRKVYHAALEQVLGDEINVADDDMNTLEPASEPKKLDDNEPRLADFIDREKLREVSKLLEVKKLRDAAIEKIDKSSADEGSRVEFIDVVNGMCDRREEEIRSTRGEQSNG